MGKGTKWKGWMLCQVVSLDHGAVKPTDCLFSTIYSEYTDIGLHYCKILIRHPDCDQENMQTLTKEFGTQLQEVKFEEEIINLQGKLQKKILSHPFKGNAAQRRNW